MRNGRGEKGTSNLEDLVTCGVIRTVIARLSIVIVQQRMRPRYATARGPAAVTASPALSAIIRLFYFVILLCRNDDIVSLSLYYYCTDMRVWQGSEPFFSTGRVYSFIRGLGFRVLTLARCTYVLRKKWFR